MPDRVAANLNVPRPTRRHSVNAPPVTKPKAPRFDVRRSLDSRRQKSVQDPTLISEPKESARIAAVFEELVPFDFSSYSVIISANISWVADESILYLRGVRSSI